MIKELTRLKEATNMFDDMSIMNLTAALEDTTGGGVWAAWGVAELERIIWELPKLFQRNTELLNESEKTLRLGVKVGTLN